MRYTVTFDEVKAQATRSGRCPGCAKSVRRSTTFTETVSPFNKISDRSRPKTYAEVQRSVDAKAKAWNPDPEVFRHERCR